MASLALCFLLRGRAGRKEPLTAGILTPDAADESIPKRRQAKLDRLYQAVSDTLNKLTQEAGVAA